MKAWVLYGIGDLRYEDVDVPKLKQGEVLVAVKAAGICGSDIARVYQTGAHVHPLIPGHEFSGMVTELGENVDSNWLGKRVGVFPLIPCGKCQPCCEKMYELCENYNYLGSRRNGGFAEYVAVPADNLIELPEQVSYEQAAMLEPMAVAVHAMRRARIRKEDTVVICGAGTIGIALLMFLLEAGIENVLLIGNKEYQKKKALELGLAEEYCCDNGKRDASQWVMEQTNGKGADICFECVGKNETVELLLEVVAAAGRLVLVGNPHSDMLLKKELYWKILRKQIAVTGTWNSSFTKEMDDDWHYVMDKLRSRKIAPEKLISHKFPSEGVVEGLRVMRNKTEEYVKIMVKGATV